MRLSFQIPSGSFRAIDLDTLETAMVIGRDRESAQLVIPDAQISRAHCVIRREGGQLLIEDLGSRNGTWVNKVRVDKAVALQPKDVITIGASEIRVSPSGTSNNADPLLGKRLGGFELLEILGQGSYGTVYRGVQVALHRSVAVKVLDERHKKDPGRVKEFLTEARRAGRLNHPNVVQVHDVCQVEGELFLVMELMTGGSMADLLRVEGPVDAEAALHLMVDVGRALGYAESQRLVHRDVKPDNILVSEDGVYKLADLGIAAPIDEDGVVHQVKAFGSAHYVAPEQAMGGTIDGRADIYALGASLFHLISGHTMYEGTSRQIVTHHVKTPPPDLRKEQLQSRFPSALMDLVMQMLEKDPARRPASGNDIAEKAQALLDKGLGSSPGISANPMRRRLMAKRGRRPGGGGGGALRGRGAMTRRRRP